MRQIKPGSRTNGEDAKRREGTQADRAQGRQGDQGQRVGAERGREEGEGDEVGAAENTKGTNPGWRTRGGAAHPAPRGKKRSKMTLLAMRRPGKTAGRCTDDTIVTMVSAKPQ